MPKKTPTVLVREETRQTYIQRARIDYGSSEIEIDDDAKISVVKDKTELSSGAWVQAWVWISDSGDNRRIDY